jgi:hypothetical protein
LFSEFTTAQLEVAPFRARLVWADALDDYLDQRDLRGGEPALRRVRDVLRDPDAVVARDELLRVRSYLIGEIGERPDDPEEASRRALALAQEFGDGAGRRWPPA